MIKTNLNNELIKYNLNKKNDFIIDIVYYSLNPIFNSYFNLIVENKENISKKIKPILYLSRHYDEIDILCQQKISKEVRERYPYYMVKKDLEFLNKLSLGIVPFYRGRDLNKDNYNHIEINKKIINELIPKILSSREDFVIYPEGTRRKGKKFRIQNKVLEDIVKINNITNDKFNLSPNIVSVDYKRDGRNIFMKFGKPLISKELTPNSLKEYLYESIKY